MDLPEELKARMDDLRERMETHTEEGKSLVAEGEALKAELEAWAKVNSPRDYIILKAIEAAVFDKDKPKSDSVRIDVEPTKV